MIDSREEQLILTIDNPFIVLFDEKKKIYSVYNYDEEKFYKWEIED